MSAAYRAANPEKAKAYDAAYQVAHREKRRAKDAAWYAANPERIAAYNAAYRAAWRAAHRKELKAANAAWYAANPDQAAANCHRRRGLKAGAAGTFTTEDLAARWAMYGDKCWVCGGIATATDHVKPLSKGGSNWPANLRPACGSCNSSKRDKWPFRAARNAA